MFGTLLPFLMFGILLAAVLSKQGKFAEAADQLVEPIPRLFLASSLRNACF